MILIKEILFKKTYDLGKFLFKKYYVRILMIEESLLFKHAYY
mgnify:CR=1 FL=1